MEFKGFLKTCQTTLEKTTNPIRMLTDIITGKAPLGANRSSKWSKVRKQFLKNNPTCVVCEGAKKVEVHHLVPFHVDPSRELDPNNLITLCESKRYGLNCHLLIGHSGNYRKSNPDCRMDALYLNRKIKGQEIKLG